MSERTKQLEAIFHAACERATPEERERCLNEACGGNADLRRDVEALLSAAPTGDELFRPVEQNSARLNQFLLSPVSEPTGSIIGRYKLLEKIGEGGMGVVFMAEQEQPVRRKVAIKIIKLGMDTRQVVARFEAERQALAMMDHPNIAQVLDAGATETGRPYFVMELVRGVPITEFCDKNRLPIEQRLKLFIPVCEAIQSAHQKGIIHRDIKPSNVLVTMHNGVPHPMVIDFGVAKAIDQKLTEKTLFTNFATMIGTPAYMSPEQAEMSKLDVDTRSDIYSLGVLLYELLTGTTPFPEERLRSMAYGEMQRIIAEEEPERPSTRLQRILIAKSSTQTPKLKVDGDLDWIVMKCLEKDRNRRYETATGLAADIQAHLNNEPVTARPPSASYRFKKLVRRNRSVSIAVGFITSAIVLGIIISTWALVRERASRRQSDEGLQASLMFVDDVFYKVAPKFVELAGAAEAQERLGQAGFDFLQRLQAHTGDDPRLRLSLARVFIKMSEGQNTGNANSVGDFEAGLRQADQAIELLSQSTLPVSTSERLYLLCWATFNRLQCLYALGRVDEAVDGVAELDSLYEKLAQAPQYAREAKREQRAIRNNAGYNLVLAGRPSEALDRFILANLKGEWAQSLMNNSTNAEGYELETMMNANGNAATAHLFLREPGIMLPYTSEAIRIADGLVLRFPLSARHARGRIAYQALHGYALMRNGNVDRGLALLKSSREEIESLLNKDTSNDQFRCHRTVTAAIQALALTAWSEDATDVSERRRRLAEAEQYLEEAEQFSRAAKTKEPEAYLKAARAEVTAAKAKLQN